MYLQLVGCLISQDCAQRQVIIELRSMKKRNVFLFGAGAAMPWGGPSTGLLTESVRSSGFFMKDGRTRITDYIYNELLKQGYQPWEANFETIINVVEELIIYHSSFNGTVNTNSLFKTFMELKNSENLLNFAVHGEKKHGYQLEIPPGRLYEDSERSFYNETPGQMFFQTLLRELITNINAAIIEYSYHSDGHSVILKRRNEFINSSFVEFMQGIASDGILRMYNLNYDRIFKVLAERSGIPVFEGFDCSETLSYDVPGQAPDLVRILEDTGSHCHYNLHGSGHWIVENEDHTQLPNPRIYMSPFMVLPINKSNAVMQIERGRTVVVSNIITGYQKAQKSFVAPFKQMQSAFDRDCLSADTLYIIGYSFGDEHVNATIRSAVIYNPKLKIVIVDPAYSEIKDLKNYNKLTVIFMKHFTGWFDYIGIRRKVKDDYEAYFGERLHVYSVGLQEFINERLTGSFT